MPILESLPCPDCGQTTKFNITEMQLVNYRTNAMSIQQVFPAMSPDDRERLVTGWCPKCWDKMFADEEED